MQKIHFLGKLFSKFIKILSIILLFFSNQTYAEPIDYGGWGTCHFIKEGSTLYISYTGAQYNGMAAATGLSSGYLETSYAYVEGSPVGGSNKLYFRGLSGIVNLLDIDRIILGEGFTVIGNEFFKNCSTLVSIKLPNSLITIMDNAFLNCNSLTSIYIPDNVQTIGKYAFSNCHNLKSILLPNSLNKIGDETFRDDISLQRIIIPNNVDTIGKLCFKNCNNLEDIRLGSAVDTIGDNPFEGCLNLRHIYCYPQIPPKIQNCNCYNPSNIELYVPCSSKDDYRAHPIWGQFDIDVPCASMNYVLLTILAESNNIMQGFAKVGMDNQYYDEVVLEYVYGGTAIQLVATAYRGCHFVQWDDGNTDNPRTITPNTSHIYTAEFEKDANRLEVTFLDWNGDVLKIDYVEMDSTAIAPIAPTRAGYLFSGWDMPLENIQSDMTITAQYVINTCTVQFVDWNGDVFSVEEVNKGESAIAPPDSRPYRLDYVFIGWDKDFSNVQEDMIVTAMYRPFVHNYTINFYAPDACEDMIPIIYTYRYDDYYDKVMTPDTDENGRMVYTYVIRAQENSSFRFYATGSNNVEDNVLQMYDEEYSWDTHWVITDQIVLPVVNQEDTIIIIDKSDNTQYRFKNCTPYTPQNLTIVSNEDGTYTISWSPVEQEDLRLYFVEILGPEGYQNTVERIYDGRTSITLDIPRSLSGEYICRVSAYGANDYGRSITTFMIDSTESHNMTMRVLVQPYSDIDITNGIHFDIYERVNNKLKWNTVEAVAEGDNWFSYTYTTTEPGVFVRLTEGYSGSYVVINRDTCMEYTNKLQYISCDVEVIDYTPYNLHAEPSAGKVLLSWEVNDEPIMYRVKVYSSDGEVVQDVYFYGMVKDITYVLEYETEMTFTWSVQPYDYYSPVGVVVEGEPFTVPPLQTYHPLNLSATDNGDGTCTISWSPVEAEDLMSYYVEMFDANGNQLFWYTVLDTINTFDLIGAGGTYSYRVGIYDSDWNDRGYSESSFEVIPMQERDIAVRILIQPSCNYDTSNGVTLIYWNPASNTNEYVSMISEGDGWYSYIWRTNDLGIDFALEGGDVSCVNFVIHQDTCLETISNQYYDTWNGSYITYIELHHVSCDAQIIDYTPHNLQAEANEDGTYTISWDPLEEERVSFYGVTLYNPEGNSIPGGYFTYDGLTYITSVLGMTGTYTYYITVYDENGSWLGQSSSSFEVLQVPERNITVRVLIQPGNYNTSNGVKLYHFTSFDNPEIITTTSEGNGWYSYTWTTSEPAVLINIRNNYRTCVAVSRDTCLEYTSDLHYVSCDAQVVDYTPYNLHAEASAGIVTLTWDADTIAAEYNIKLYLNGEQWKSYWFGNTQIAIISIANSEEATFTWSIRPYDGGWLSAAVYGDEFTIPPSPYIPQNIQAVSNGDGTYTITWDPVEAEDVAYYSLSVYDSNMNYVCGRSLYSDYTMYVTSILPTAGMYYYYLYLYDQDWNLLNYSRNILIVDPIPEHDITVRVLINPDSGFDISEGVTFSFYNYETKQYEAFDAIDEGGYWYSYTITTTDIAIRFAFNNSYSGDITTDTCFQYIEYLESVDCEAVAHDFRIIPESMTAVSVPGYVNFSWSAIDIANQYILELRDAISDEYIWGGYVNDTCFTFGVSAQYDSTIVQWLVYPSNPYIYSAGATSTVMLFKSEVELSNLTTTTTDSLTFDFSWDSNTEGLLYEIQVIFGNVTLKLDTVSTTNYHYTLHYGGNHSWAVRPLDPETKNLISDWYYGESFRTYKIPEPITNLTGSAQGHLLTFTWDMTVPQVSANLYQHLSNDSYRWIYSDILTETTLTYNVIEDGVYILELTPYIETASGDYIQAYYYYEIPVQVFDGETVSLQMNSTEGGYIWPADMSGNYSIGYTISVTAVNYSGYHFVGWSDGVQNATRIITISEDMVLTAYFELDGTITAIDNMDETADDESVRKILRDGVIYIQRGQKTYTLQGQEVR